MSTNPQVEHNDDGLWIPSWNFSDRLRRIRREVGVSQDSFANALQVKKVTLGAWESGRTQPRDLVAVAKRIELAFRVPASWTLGVNEGSRRPDDLNGGSSEWCAPRDSNPEPTVSSPAEIAEVSQSSNVVPLTQRPTLVTTRADDAEVLPFPALAAREEVDAR